MTGENVFLRSETTKNLQHYSVGEETLHFVQGEMQEELCCY
jgi:hypothetical protein